MYVPRHWHWVFPTGLILAGFYIHENLNGSWDVIVFVNVPLALIGVEWGAYLWQAGVLHQRYITHIREQSERPAERNYTVVEDEAKPAPRVVPLRNMNDEPVYSQTVPMLTFDKERHLAMTLCHQRELDPRQVDLTEKFWVKPGRYVRAEFKGTLAKWEHHHLIARRSSHVNSPYDVTSWARMREVAHGLRLPSPPPG